LFDGQDRKTGYDKSIISYEYLSFDAPIWYDILILFLIISYQVFVFFILRISWVRNILFWLATIFLICPLPYHTTQNLFFCSLLRSSLYPNTSTSSSFNCVFTVHICLRTILILSSQHCTVFLLSFLFLFSSMVDPYFFSSNFFQFK
jgi:hypothetical protein